MLSPLCPRPPLRNVLPQPVQAEHVPLAPVEAFLLGPAVPSLLDLVTDFRLGPTVAGPQGQGEVCRLAKVVDFPPGQAGVYRQVQAEENQQVLMGFYLQVPAAAAQLAPARNNDKWNRANPDCK